MKTKLWTTPTLSPRGARISAILGACIALVVEAFGCGGTSLPGVAGGSAGAGGGNGGSAGDGGTAGTGGVAGSGGTSGTGGVAGYGGAGGTGGVAGYGGVAGSAGGYGGAGGAGGGLACGGLLGNTCNRAEYCAYEGAGDCGAADATAICRARPQVCGDIYSPVCGCDGKSYPSACTAGQAGVGYRRRGTCETNGCVINGVFYPDGTTGIPASDSCNTCSCSQGQVACTLLPCFPPPRSCGGFAGNTCAASEYCAYAGSGFCGATDASALCRPRPMACPNIFSPVCACDGRTYDSACQAAAAGFGYATAGSCTPPPGCLINGLMYPDGSFGIPAGDGCNTCACKGSSVICTTQVCPSSCVINGTVYPDGASGVPDPYSCNQCSCIGGTVGRCTQAYCPLPPPCVVGRAIYRDGAGYITADGSTRCQCTAGTLSCSAVP